MSNEYVCCNDPHFHRGFIWGFRMFEVKVCCRCNEPIAVWNFYWQPLFDLLNFIWGWFMDEDEYPIEMYDETKKAGKVPRRKN